MLSPPPSPLPFVAKLAIADPNSYFHQQQLEKSTVGRRYTLTILLFPLFLIFLTIPTSCFNTLCSRFALHPTLSSPFPSDSRLNSFEASNSPPIKRDTSTSSPSSVPTVPTAPSTANGIVPTPFPQPFDLSLSWNFTTTSCQNFFLNFTQADKFRRCRPFSFLLGTSSKFTDAETNLTLLNDIIWGTCNTVEEDSNCQNVMKSYGSDLQIQCKTELQRNTLLVQQASIGFQLYEPMRQAGCLVNNGTSSYCFLEAVASSSPSDLYFYQLPYGNLLPNNTVPSCSSCIKNVLSIYGQVVAHPPSFDLAVLQDTSTSQFGTQTFASQSIPLDNTYQGAADLASQECGSVYVQQTSTSGAFSLQSSHFYLIYFGAFLLFYFTSSCLGLQI